MIHDFIVWLFGVAALGALCNLPAWARLLWDGWKHRRPPWQRDAFLLVRVGMLFAAVAVGLAAWLRASSFMEYPVTQPPQVVSFFGSWPTALPSWGPVAWILPMAVSQVAFLRVAALAARAKGRKARAGSVFVCGMMLWTPFVAIVHP